MSAWLRWGCLALMIIPALALSGLVWAGGWEPGDETWVCFHGRLGCGPPLSFGEGDAWGAMHGKGTFLNSSEMERG